MKPVALTMGEPSGIGPEITLKAWMRRQEGLPPFFAIADPDLLRKTAARAGWTVPIVVLSKEDDGLTVFREALPVLPVLSPVHSVPGKPDLGNAAGVLHSIETAVSLARSRRVCALVTNPIAKHILQEAGFPHPGHTEYLAALASDPGKEKPQPVMMLWCEELATIPVTVHLPLRRVADALNTDLIVSTGRIAARDLRTRFGIARPRLAVAGLNPHAGENGSMGDEEKMIIAPAIIRMKQEDIEAEGPFPADTLFHESARAHYDAALCMYHDQALIPIKTLAFDRAVNVTLGLPFIRTSPDHGTAFDIAGTGQAKPDSLMAALRLALRLGQAS